MNEIEFVAFKEQKEFLKCNKRVKGAFSGKRGGKTEVGAIQSIIYQETKPNNKYFYPYTVDPYLGVVMAPTFDMLRRLSLKKFMAYAKPFIVDFNKTSNEISWHDESQVYGLSAEKPERIEGIKAAWIWLDEVFQMSEQLFLECRARVADSQGFIICTGSLGLQFVNPKMHWAHKYFKEIPGEDFFSIEWPTQNNPYFPKQELETLKSTLDPQTFRAMFELCWDVLPQNAVYNDFTEDNIIKDYVYNEGLPTYVSIDWGFAHDMAVGFFQTDYKGHIYLFDEIVQSRLTLEELYNKIKIKLQHYNITDWCCDIAGNQEREQIGLSNVKWFKQNGIHMKYVSGQKQRGIQYGISLVRSFIKTMSGQRRFYISSQCKKSIDGMRQYRYPEKDGIIQNENPIKKDDDAVDMIRYFFINFMDQNAKSNARSVIRNVR